MEREPSADWLPPVGADLVIPAMAIGFATYFFWSIDELSWEAKANGVIIGWTLVGLAVAQVARTVLAVARGRGSLSLAALTSPRDLFVKRLGLVAVSIAFLLGMHVLGVTLALFACLVLALYLLGIRRWKLSLAIATVTSAAVYVLFIVVLDAAFPHGPVERLLAAILG